MVGGFGVVDEDKDAEVSRTARNLVHCLRRSV